eukprot:GHRQ01023661.1.p1 GENE.GHRQ01023661.1~~GHRQ01023661.1.p1  ORF type:complete len:183 (+),score=91.75 GHRQ01023661.1:130-678(+)
MQQQRQHQQQQQQEQPQQHNQQYELQQQYDLQQQYEQQQYEQYQQYYQEQQYYQLDARGKVENHDEADWFVPLELPFKRAQNVSASMAAKPPHQWKRLRQLIAAENYQDLPADTPTYMNMDAPPSMYPPKAYCDITGCEAPYVDPKTHLRYANADAFRVARSLMEDDVQARLAIRNAQVVLK